MNTPIFDFVKQYAASDSTRFHMPGHKGIPMLGCEPFDITEIDGADVLYSAEGIIEVSEQNASRLFGTAHTYYSTEGSSLVIKAMLALVAEDRKTGERPLIIAARNVHRAFVHAAALLDLDVTWLYAEENSHLCSCVISAAQVEEAIKNAPRRPAALYLTSPDYLGQMTDIAAIASVCKAYGVPLLVDNAHGAYLRFLKQDLHPITLGATMCCDSAHKTLPVLTGGAYLHIAPDADPSYCKNARRALSLFSSTSPSYLILQSLDLCNRYLNSDYPTELKACVERIGKTKSLLEGMGFACDETEPLKIVLNAAKYGYTGTALAKQLRTFQIEAEFADGEYLVLMATPQNREHDFDRLEQAFAGFSPKSPITRDDFPINQTHETVCSIREAIFARQERVSASASEGRVCASPTVSCPPAVPVVICGERITKEDIARLCHYGIEGIEVVAE